MVPHNPLPHMGRFEPLEHSPLLRVLWLGEVADLSSSMRSSEVTTLERID